MKRMFYVVRGMLYPLAALLVPCKIMNKDKYKKYDRGQVLVSNHLSWMDIAYQLFWLPGYKRFLSKKENSGGKFQKWFIGNMGVIFVNREKPELSSLRECVSALQNGEVLSVFPEGKRNKIDREIQPMHNGAAMFAIKGRASVVPMAIHHKGKLFHRNYIGIGDPVDISDLFESRLGENVLDEVTERMKRGIMKTLAELDVWVENKGWKIEKKRIKKEKKELERRYKTAKREAKKASIDKE